MVVERLHRYPLTIYFYGRIGGQHTARSLGSEYIISIAHRYQRWILNDKMKRRWLFKCLCGLQQA